MRGREQWIFAARNITTDRIDRNMLVSEHDTGESLDFNVLHRISLEFREVSHLRLRELDVVQIRFDNFETQLWISSFVRR
jgi:hypothetical protein